jgi:hypothetical protein
MPIITITYFLTSAILILDSKIQDKSKVRKIHRCSLLQYMHEPFWGVLKAVAKIFISFANLMESTKKSYINGTVWWKQEMNIKINVFWGVSKMFVNLYQTKWHYIPEDSNFHSHCRN